MERYMDGAIEWLSEKVIARLFPDSLFHFRIMTFFDSL
ncbi:hypothetical protein BRO54_1903 [Geobacillus proteiniphilus]|uniref:Uncharacterized protein n=1 Tax=Geobacillus proteiniphilus TaxID=860353 RepID=A0A1Q5SZZ4_9BACL|nr:hypothetical protein BRO54_1903 [Geobacillus proteiniphilus]